MLKTETKNGVSTITARGELDRFDCPRLREELQGAEGQVALDLAKVGFIDSQCAQLVSEEAERFRGEGSPIRMKVSPSVLRMMEMLSAAGLKSARNLLSEQRVFRISVA